MPGHRDWIRSLSASGPTLLSGDAGSTLGIWDLPSQRNRCMYLHPNWAEIQLNVLMDLAFMPGSDSCFLMLQRSGRLTFADLRVRDFIQWTTQLGMAKPSMLKILENQHQFLISARESEMRLWDIRASPPACVQLYAQHKAESLPIGFDFLAYEKYVVTGSDDGCAYIYETLTGCLARKIKLGNGQQLNSCCAESPDSLSFFATFDSARYLGLVDSEGTDISHEFATTAQIKDAYSKNAWDAALGKFTERLTLHMQRLMGGTPYAQNNWVVLLRASEEDESRKLLTEIEAEYNLQLEASSPALVKDLTAFHERKQASLHSAAPLKVPVRQKRCGSMAPRVRKDCAFAVAVRPRHVGEL